MRIIFESPRFSEDLDFTGIDISSDYLPPYSLFALKTDLLVKEKIDAAISRKKPRDFFDIYFLLRSRLITPNQKELLKKVEKTLENADFDFSGELKQFLPVSIHPVIKNFRETFSSELRRNLP